MSELHAVIQAPLVTEKGTFVGESSNQVLFRVRRDATKGQIREAIEKLFDVRVARVRTINVLGKTRRVGRSMGRRADWKKAYVTLAEGQRIDFFENV